MLKFDHRINNAVVIALDFIADTCAIAIVACSLAMQH
jgi:hypothetical protein